MRNRRRTDPHVDFRGTGITQSDHQFSAGGPAHNRVVDHDDALASQHIRERVELDPNPGLSHRLRGLNKRPPHIAVLDQTIRVGNSTLLGKPDSSWNPRVGNADHQISIDGRLTGKGASNPLPVGVQRFAEKTTVRSSKINHLEDAKTIRLFAPALAQQIWRPQLELHQLTGLNVIDILRANDFKTAGFTAHHPLACRLIAKEAKDERTDSMTITDGE